MLFMLYKRIQCLFNVRQQCKTLLILTLSPYSYVLFWVLEEFLSFFFLFSLHFLTIFLTCTEFRCLHLVINCDPVSRPMYAITLWMPWWRSLISITGDYTPISKVCLSTKTFFGHLTQIILCNDSFEFWACPWSHFGNKLSDDNSIKTGLMISWIHFGILRLSLYVFSPVILSLWCLHQLDSPYWQNWWCISISFMSVQCHKMALIAFLVSSKLPLFCLIAIP